MATVGLDDLKFEGYLYTWTSKRVSDPTLKKLDCVLVNSMWEDKFHGSVAKFLTAGVSDHSPMVVKLAELPRRKIPFRFFDFWMGHPDIIPLVAQVWGEAVVGTPMFCLCSKLKKLKLALKHFNKEHFSKLPTRVTQARTDIEHVQCLIQHSPLDSSLHREEARLQKEFCELSRAEEGFLRQKSRVKWLNLGDQNTAFFFKVLKSHYGKSKMVSICKDDGTRVEEPHEISEVIVAFYQNLLGQQSSGESLDMDLLRKALPKNNKAPGPYGFNAVFIRRTWSIVGNDVLCAIKHCGPQQTAFVKGRHISDNILLSQELLRNDHRMGGLPRCALKIDLMKAYDSIHWDFLFAVFRVIGFPERVVRWIIECVTTTRSSISINGELHGFFAGGAEVGSVSLIGKCINRFKALFGLIPNLDKSNLFASGVSSYLKDQLLDVLGYKEGVLPVRYLGVSLISTKLRALDCKKLVDRIIARAKSWTCRALSYAGSKWKIHYGPSYGRVVTLASVGAKVAWAKIYMPKEEGGLGLWSLEIWNKAAMLKYLWSLCTDSASSL
ncbi:uncharacterized protein LOC111395190 [Olea europaea var. sylvestris]|uniref:uncharacterized protein LOC111395190 n=1 Tax=Olea europaea var. sylvestris TaxID=158386 RepID=UPI000C1D79C2|nr:uncharacterized protein LOC111395190 [Olea europaea var. sylvestris]